MSLMADIRVKNDLGHPLCENLRQGNWLMDCVVGRLRLEPTTMELANWLDVSLRARWVGPYGNVANVSIFYVIVVFVYSILLEFIFVW